MVGVVVKYRVSGENNAIGRFPGPLLDARQALRVTRRHASALEVDPRRIGVIGFSAGGHLAAMPPRSGTAPCRKKRIIR